MKLTDRIRRFFAAGPPNALTEVDVPWLPIRDTGGEHVSHQSALQVAAVWACVRLISEAIAGLPWHVFERNGESRERVDSQTDWLLSRQWSEEMSSQVGRETMLAHALLWGNGYAEIERSLNGQPFALHLITPDRVQVDRDSDTNRLVYEIDNGRRLNSENMFHLRGLGFDGLQGYSVVSFAARTIAAGLASDKYLVNFFGNNLDPGIVLEFPHALGEDQIKKLRNQFTDLQGAKNRRKPLILENDMKARPLSIPPEDAQFLESRKFTVNEIARWFRVQPHKIADLDRATFSNIEAQGIEFVTDTLMPWVTRLETEADIKLFGFKQRRTRFSKINVNGLLRGDSEARASFYTQMFQMGALSPNEIRSLEELNPVADGDKRFVQVNLTTLEKAGEEPEPAPAPVMPEPEEEEEEPQVRAVLRNVLVNAEGRCFRREAARFEDACKRYEDQPGKFDIWLKRFISQHAKYVAEQIDEALSAFPASVASAPIADAYTERVAAQLRDCYESRSGFEGIEYLADAVSARLEF